MSESAIITNIQGGVDVDRNFKALWDMHSGFVMGKYRGYAWALGMDGVEQACKIGMWRAVRKFRVGRGRFMSYANFWVCKQVMTELRLRDTVWVPPTASRRGEVCTVVSLDKEDADGLCGLDLVVVKECDPVEVNMDVLSDVERDIVSKYFGLGCDAMTLVDLGREYGTNRTSIWNRINIALRKLRGEEVRDIGKRGRPCKPKVEKPVKVKKVSSRQWGVRKASYYCPVVRPVANLGPAGLLTPVEAEVLRLGGGKDWISIPEIAVKLGVTKDVVDGIKRRARKKLLKAGINVV